MTAGNSSLLCEMSERHISIVAHKLYFCVPLSLSTTFWSWSSICVCLRSLKFTCKCVKLTYLFSYLFLYLCTDIKSNIFIDFFKSVKKERKLCFFSVNILHKSGNTYTVHNRAVV